MNFSLERASISTGFLDVLLREKKRLRQSETKRLPLEIYPLPFSSFDSLIIPFLGFNREILFKFFFFLHRASNRRSKIENRTFFDSNASLDNRGGH